MNSCANFKAEKKKNKKKSCAKFKTVFEKKEIPKNKKNPELIGWCRKFSELGLAPAEKNYSCGNMSFRTKKGFIITASGAGLGKIRETELVEVIECNEEKFELTARGMKEPSSESFIHSGIYRKRKEINAVFHGHSEIILKHSKELKAVETKKFAEFGTIDLLKEIMKILGKEKFIAMKRHGFIALGKSMDEAGKIALKNYFKAKKTGEITLKDYSKEKRKKIELKIN